MSNSLIICGVIRLFNWIDHDTSERVDSVAVLPADMAKDWEGFSINVIDWRIADDRQTVKLTYQTRNDAYAPILDAILPLRVDRFKLRPPTRSRNWKLEQHSDYWRNSKTGERVMA
jgi:hypothetical protein